MAHPFEVSKEIEVDATPEEVWEAIATGPGIDSWFMGRNEVEPGEGGKARMVLTRRNTTRWSSARGSRVQCSTRRSAIESCTTS